MFIQWNLTHFQIYPSIHTMHQFFHLVKHPTATVVLAHFDFVSVVTFLWQKLFVWIELSVCVNKVNIRETEKEHSSIKCNIGLRRFPNNFLSIEPSNHRTIDRHLTKILPSNMYRSMFPPSHSKHTYIFKMISISLFLIARFDIV